MPPKRKIVSSGRSAKKRRVTATAPTEPDVVTTTSTTVSQGPAIASQSLPIDYDLLAAAIIRKSQPPQEQPLNCPASTSPQVQTCPSSSQPTEQHHNNYAPSQPEVIQPANPSGIGALLDQVFLGEPAGSNQPSIDIKEGIPLGASVSSKLKAKIWNHEFIDLRSLLDNGEEPLSVTISTGVINLHQGQKSKYPISLSQWTDAFLIFSAIYMVKFPQEGPNLLKYCHMVREMQYLHGDNAFRLYDEQFRKLKESVNIPWQNPVQELRLRAATVKAQYSKQPQSQQPFRAKICFQYNKGERCTRTPCPFKHCCLQCKATHPKNKCPDVSKYQFSKPSNPSPSNKT